MRKYRIRKYSLLWFLKGFALVTGVLFIGWFGISYIDILIHNLAVDGQCASWNFFTC